MGVRKPRSAREPLFPAMQSNEEKAPPEHTELRARLAPSPTGALHLGNLSTSWLTWLHTRTHGGTLLLRIEDIDEVRCSDDAIGSMIKDLRWCGIDWDEGYGIDADVARWRQSYRKERYERALELLRSREEAYACTCSRREVREALGAPHERFDPGLTYPGTCAWRSASDVPEEDHAWRFRAEGFIEHNDEIFGHLSGDIARAPGDIVIRRRDGLFGYHLAVVVDDLEMGINHVSRGADLLESVLIQRALRAALGGDSFATAHFPVLHDASGARLSKRDGSLGLEALREAGWTRELLLGGLCVLWGWTDNIAPHTPEDALRRFDTATLRQEALIVPDAFFEGPGVYAEWIAQND